jgi:hypothetical protein
MSSAQLAAARLLPNLGAEEGARWERFSNEPRVRETARLWRSLFAWPNALVGTSGSTAADAEAWPPALGTPPDAPVFDWLEGGDVITPWLADLAARERIEQEGGRWASPPPDIVRSVHDKAFALRESTIQGYEPRALRGLSHIFEPSELAQPDDFLVALRAALAAWPDWTHGRFTLKPRQGGSGRGRIGGRADALDPSTLRGSLPRLSERGGAILEPWLDRSIDLSVLLHLDPAPDSSAPIVMLASLEQWVTPSGGWQGHLGEIDSRGRVFSGSEFDEPMREAAAALAGAARARGLHGPCGVDGLAFRLSEPGGEAREVLRPMLELNARFTAGFVTLGLIRRALPSVRGPLGLEPGERRGFLFALDVPGGAADWESLARELGDGAQLVPLSGGAQVEPSPLRPALLFARELEPLQAIVRRRAAPKREASG